MTLTTMLSELYRRLDFQSSPAAAVTTRLTAFLNDAYQEILSTPGLGERLTRTTASLNSVASTAEYDLPAGVQRVIAITERTNDIKLAYLSLERYRAMEPDPSASSGTSTHWVPVTQDSIALWPTPASAIAYTIDYEADITELSGGTDEPILPTRFHRLLVTGARMREYEKTDDTRYMVAKQEWDKGLAELKHFVLCPADYIPAPGRRRIEHSRLGAYYPGDRY